MYLQSQAGKVIVSNRLVRDYFKSITKDGVVFHVPLNIGLQDNQMRGLYLVGDQVVPQGHPIATIPLEAVVTSSSVMRGNFALPNVTRQAIANMIQDSEMKNLAPHLHVAAQVCHMISQIPDRSRFTSLTQFDQCDEMISEKFMSFARLLDDENFDEEYISETYFSRLDTFQFQLHKQLHQKYVQAVKDVYTHLDQPQFAAGTLHRIGRVVIARTEQFPSQISFSKWRRLIGRFYRYLRKRPPPTSLGIIPLVEMLNHSNRPTVHIRFSRSLLVGGQPAAVLYALKNISPGTELARQYNFSLPQGVALFRWGFLPFDSFTVVEHDTNQFYMAHYKHMAPEAEYVKERRIKEEKEIEELDHLFKS